MLVFTKPFLKFERILSGTSSVFLVVENVCFFVARGLTRSFSSKIIKKKLKYSGMFYSLIIMGSRCEFFLESLQAAILTVDGVGEWATTVYGVVMVLL